MSASIGVNLRVTGHCRQGGRKYMEDFFCVAYQQTEDEKDLEYAFCGIYDGHGGAEAAAFAKEHLMEAIIKHKNFWSDNDEDVLRAIKDGYIATHYAMWKEQEKWPKTASGLPSTAGTTASIAFIRRGKIYIGHVGDSGIILGYQEPGSPEWKAMPLTRDHKPENADELSRIEQCGGKVVAKSGVPRVVWNRPKIGHQGPVRRSTPIDEIPFLAVARSLGDLWSYNSQINQFIVSPDPDCSVIHIDTNIHRCLIFGTDGLFNMLSPSMAVYVVQNAEIHNEFAALDDCTFKTWLNPSKLLVEKALQRWHATKMRADNTSVVTLMLDPPGPPKSQILKDRKKNSYPDRGLKIVTRYEDNSTQENCTNADIPTPSVISTSEEEENQNSNIINNNNNNNSSSSNNNNVLTTNDNSSVSSSDITSNFPLKERNFVPKSRDSTSFDPREPRSSLCNDKENLKTDSELDNTIQIHEISSSSNDMIENDSENVTTKHNLRSTKSVNTAPVPDDEKTKKKRKFDNSAELAPRKSIRIDHNQKKNNITQKILRSKKINLEKQKQKIKMVMKTVNSNSSNKKNLPSTSNSNVNNNSNSKSSSNSIVEKSQRKFVGDNSLNKSSRRTNLDVNAEFGGDMGRKELRKSVRCLTSSASNNNSSSPKPLPPPPHKKPLPKITSSVKITTKNLRKKIQQKTANLRKNVKRK